MKKILHLTAVMLVLCALLAAMTGCSGGNSGNGSGSNNTGGGNTGTGNQGGDTGTSTSKVEYTVSVKTIGGRPVSKLAFLIYEEEDLIAYGQTDTDGVGKVSIKPSDNYTVVLSASDLEGYDVADSYTFTNKSASIVLTSHVIEDSNLTGVQYELGDIIRDFTVLTSDGKTTFTLSEALKTKKAVLINFWYSSCGPCVNEFPYMQSAYEKYKDDLEIIALNNYSGDNEDSVSLFKQTMGLTFPVAKDYSRLGSAFNIQGYPTSILIDRYGTICLIEVGGLTSEKPFVAAFEHFTADDYQQTLFNSIGELTPTERPNISMPSSDEIGAVLNANGFTADYTPETETTDAEYSWPFIVGTKDGESCIIPANSYKDGSFATMHATVDLAAGQALAIDWFAETELGSDCLYVLVDGKDIIQISGVSEQWQTCYPFVAIDDGTYKVSFIYLKDGDTDVEEDRVYLKNFRIVDDNAVNAATYIPRQAATKPNANGLGFQNYATVVYNETDGYYHVGAKNGPILLVDLMGSTLLSEVSLNDLGYNGELKDSKGDVYESLVTFCNYAINGTLYGYSPVTEELKVLLERTAEIIGFERGNPNQWLQACSYYDAYGTDKQLDDPVKGIAFFAAFDTVLSTDSEIKYNTVVYDGRVIMPRGLKYKFVPQVSGAYIIKSQSKDEVNGWIFDDAYNILLTAEVVDRPYNGVAPDTTNVSMIIYLEAGKTYYIDIAYYDIYAAGTFTFTVEYLGATYNHFHIASPSYFTYIESATGQLNETIAGGINVALNPADGLYHEVLADGSFGSIVYADFKYPTGLFSHSIVDMITLGGFNFSYNETDQQVIAKLKELGGDKAACLAYYKQLWGNDYAEWEAIYMLEEVLDGIYHGEGEDLTDEINEYLSKMITGDPVLEGCVAVDAGLAELLQALMDKYSLSGVKNSWTKLCYYYKVLG